MNHCVCGSQRFAWTDDSHTRVRCCVCFREYTAARADTFQDQRDEVFIRAVELGCTPVWVGFRWECRCPSAAHGLTTVSPSITTSSLARFEKEYEAV